jgi:alpha-ketoglutarate-dependent taurine dioxygenase
MQFQPIDKQLEFDTSVFPSVIIKPSELEQLPSVEVWIQENLSALESRLSTSGAILFRGFPVDSAESFDTFSAAFEYPSFTYRESLSNAVRVNLTERVFTANEAPKDVEIFLHHEMAQTPLSPDKLFFFCRSAATSGGATPICRSDKLFAALHEEDPALAAEFSAKGLKYITHMPSENDPQSGQGRSWRSTLSADTVDAAEEKLSQLGYTWSWDKNGGLRAVTPILPAVRTLDNGTQVFYNQLIAAYLGWQGVKQDPSRAITFGDGSALPVTGLQRIVELSSRYTFDIPWQDGDIALIDNKLTMHGRRPFSGTRQRQVLVTLAA